MQYINVGRLAVWHHRAMGRRLARVLLIHGICEHSGRHLNTVTALTRQGYDVVRFDLRGSGHSGGRRQYVERFFDYVEDTLAVFNWAQSTEEPAALFLMGHSLGGAIAIHTSMHIQHALSGLILSAPAFLTGSAISSLKIALGRLINRVLPTFRITNDSDRHCISRIPEVVEAYYRDPLCSHFNTVRQGDSVLTALSQIPKIVPAIEIPLFIAHGTHDRLIRIEGSYEIFTRAASKNRLFYIIPGGYHEPHNDWGMEEYFTAITTWLVSQLEQSIGITEHRSLTEVYTSRRTTQQFPAG